MPDGLGGVYSEGGPSFVPRKWPKWPDRFPFGRFDGFARWGCLACFGQIDGLGNGLKRMGGPPDQLQQLVDDDRERRVSVLDLVNVLPRLGWQSMILEGVDKLDDPGPQGIPRILIILLYRCQPAELFIAYGNNEFHEGLDDIIGLFGTYRHDHGRHLRRQLVNPF